ncbi:CoA transferase [Candidatus Poriferisodalis sp.]|uniref:CaiB/BaiF CoA-transferase family protein n=1 Tax=Candidatus Poriferisodalis sp. TaxID=3101277 RepID=UPI003B02BA1A
MLDGYRILDLTDDRGHLAGLLLAQLGAEVVLCEPPGGHRTRHRGPHVDDVVDPERAIEFLVYNRGKHSLVIEDPAWIAELAAGCDAVISCGAFDVDLDALRAADPALVTASITPFGETGPKTAWAATDLTIAASSGTMSLTGDRDRAPVRIGSPQTWHNAAVDTAGAVLMALHERQTSGLGQHVDTSAQQSFVDCTQFQMMTVLTGGDVPVRLPGAVDLGGFLIPWVYECADGHVTVTFLFGPMIAPFTSRILSWACDEGFCEPDLRDKDWVDFGMAIVEGRESMDTFDRAIKALTAFVASKTKAELLERALTDNLLIAPVTTTADVLALEQLEVRDYWEHVDVPRAGGPAPVRLCGSLAKTTAGPLPVLPVAPKLGEHTELYLGDSGPAGTGITSRPRAEIAATGRSMERPLDDVKVLDFMWALAGPGATRTLADYGATVVKVESELKPDVLRGVHPFIGEEGGQENALQFHSINAGKMDLTLDLSLPEAREVVLDLVAWCDVLTESFSPKAMENWGLTYDVLREVNPELVMFSSCLMGQTGPMRLYAGFGTMAAAIAGFYPVTGWPDRIPAGPFTAYTDYISPKLGVMLILSALAERDRTGRGQHIDFAQMEGALHFLATEFADEEINGRTAGRSGNADRHMCPHSVYPAAGDDRWVAIACETDEHWGALAALLAEAAAGNAELAQALDTLSADASGGGNASSAGGLSGLNTDSRRAHAETIDAAITAWTEPREAADIEAALQACGVPAHRVSDAADLMADPQIVAREHFLSVPHAKHGHTWVENSNFELSRTPGRPLWGGPMFGEHNMEVLEGILGYDADKVAELVIAGALT